jgi:hypothetical protein
MNTTANIFIWAIWLLGIFGKIAWWVLKQFLFLLLCVIGGGLLGWWTAQN